MTSIYVDPTALALSLDGTGDGVAPGAIDAVVLLIDSGFEVVVLGDEPDGGPLPELPDGVRRATALPEHLDHDAWYLTGEPYPAFGRPRGGTTVLIGPRRPAGRIPFPRFDVESRDIASAAMEILTRQAMA